MESQISKVAKFTVVDFKTEVLATQIVDSAFKVHEYFGS